jgi:hypothetical protein
MAGLEVRPAPLHRLGLKGVLQGLNCQNIFPTGLTAAIPVFDNPVSFAGAAEDMIARENEWLRSDLTRQYASLTKRSLA